MKMLRRIAARLLPSTMIARVRSLENLRRAMARGDYVEFAPPGHFYSPLPALGEINRLRTKLFDKPPRSLPGIDLRETEQLELLQTLLPYYDQLDIPNTPTPGRRYHFDNPYFRWSDGFFLEALLRHFRPRRFTEIGSGYSSALALDTNDRWLGGQLKCTFIDPNPERLRSLLVPGDEARARIVPQAVQEVDPAVFDDLAAGDLLFIDASHVAKVGSDVNFEVFEVLPRLTAGVLVHVHDIFYPFRYPEEWTLAGCAWNEAYVYRAFLQYNSEFEILLWNTFLEEFHRPWFEQHMPRCLQNLGGSLWLRRKS